MATKLGKNEYPSGVSANDLKTYGPVAQKDTEFHGFKMADFGCFNQDSKVDSNKYYVVQQCTDPSGNWYVYVEYGRQGASKPQFQFIKCSSEAEAQKEFVSKCDEKNTKRGQWDTVAGMKMFVPKPGKDMYLVRHLAKRTHGLPDGQTLTSESAITTPIKRTNGVKKYRCDHHTTKLMRDLLGGVVSYTRSALQGGTIPSQVAIDEARDMLISAKKRLVITGDDIKTQVNDKDLKQITYALYSRIPKIKPLHCPEIDWILSKNNVFGWEQDLDAFESALNAGSVEDIAEDDPLHTFPSSFQMEWVEPHSSLGEWLYNWWPNASRNKHAGVGKMKILNLWKINRGDCNNFESIQKNIAKEIKQEIVERPFHQDKKRVDLDTIQRKSYWETNTALTFHGSATVNVPGILKEHFRVPKELVGVVLTASMFGAFGSYMADDWRKSDGYTSRPGTYWASGRGSVKGRQAFMFACDSILGIPHVASGAKGYIAPPNGTHCVFGKAGHSGVQNNEFVVVPKQIQQKYLIEYTI